MTRFITGDLGGGWRQLGREAARRREEIYPFGKATGEVGSGQSEKVTRMFSEEIEEIDFAEDSS